MALENQFINIHSHRKPQSEEEWVLRNAFHVLDEHKISKLNYAVSVGLHPWHINADFEQNIAHIESLLHLNNVLALGEIGLDRAIDTDFELQKHIFEIQLKLAEQYKKPVIVHAVRAYSDLMPYLKKTKIPFILHQYRGNEIQTKQLVPLENVFFSFGKDLIKKTEKAVTTFKEIPLNKIFLETDVTNHDIRDVYRKASELKKNSVEDLKHRIYQNFTELFKL